MTANNQASDQIRVDPSVQWVETGASFDHLRSLLADYAQALDVAYCREEVETELAQIAEQPSDDVRFLIATVEGEAAACLGVRPLGGGRIELERLFVRPSFRRHGLARRLTEVALVDAAERGASEAVLHTLAHWTAACALYRQLGFSPIEPYRHVPEPGVLFFGRSLSSRGAA